MGKASRRKKEKRAQVAAAQTKKADPKKGKKGKKSLKKVLKKAKPQKKQQKSQKTRKKVTIAALDKKAAAVESALSSAVKKAQEVVAKKGKTPQQKASQKEKPQHDVASNVKEVFAQWKQSFQDGMDPDKLENLKKEATMLGKKGGLYLTGIVSVVAILIVLELHSHGRTFPGMVIAGVDVGYIPVSQAAEKINSEVNTYLQQPAIFSFEGDTFEVSKQELGIMISADETAAQLAVSRFQEESPVRLLAASFMKSEMPSVYAVKSDQVVNLLEDKLFLKDKRARNARFAFQEDGSLIVEPEKSGFAINRDKLMADISTNLDTLGTATINIEIEEENPIITAAELEKERDRLIGLLNKSIALNADDRSLSIKLIDHLHAVHFKPVNMSTQPVAMAHANPVEEATVRIAIDKNGMKDFLYENLIAEIERPTSPAKIYRNEEGKVIIEGKGEDGRSISQEDLVEALNEAVNVGADTVEVPVVVDKAPLDISDDLKALGIEDLLATGHSAYYGSSAGRMYNIEYGASKYNGHLIAPGEEFSFNEILGPVDGANGFKIAKVIKQNKLELEYGGGICQVSTTLYRAALQAGLQITERRPHSWKVSYYGQSMGHGLDATIYPGVVDLKFTNDTPGHLLIQSYIEDAEAYFKIYGTDDGRQTVLDGPYGGGLSYRWNRTVLDKDGNPLYTEPEAGGLEEIWSQYKPIPVDPPPESAPAPAPAPAPSGEISEGF